jgi:alcohol dehydrogenase/L-iditol 2-dehydrogenase
VIEVHGVGLCGSDLAVFSGKWAAPEYPWIPGHEAFGRIVAVGARVRQERVGEIVVVEPNVACFDCAQCALGRTSACLRRRSVGMNRPGALAEKVAIRATNAWSIASASERDLVCVEPLAVVDAAIRRLGDPVPGTALVVGQGSQGLLMTLALTERRARVLAYDVNDLRMALATRLGATVLAPSQASAGVELVVDTVGTPASIEIAMRHVATGGRILILSLDDTPLQLTAQTLVRRQLTIVGSLTYDHPDDFRSTVARVQAGVIAPGQVITEEYSFADAQRAYTASREAGGKTWIRVAGSTRS